MKGGGGSLWRPREKETIRDRRIAREDVAVSVLSLERKVSITSVSIIRCDAGKETQSQCNQR